ncbi:MAG: hypothetical protein JNJ85_11275 [Candidatus Kapabacteria bacterium]|nr:hypothetical protein [Candidatus Kapabacteria bacterium]
MYDSVITGIGIGCVFASNYADSFRFYHELLELSDVVTMNEHSCYFVINEKVGIYLIGGYQLPARNPECVGTTFAFEVTSVQQMFNKMRDAGIQLLHSDLVQMTDIDFWFQCLDPSGNIIEFIGKK